MDQLLALLSDFQISDVNSQITVVLFVAVFVVVLFFRICIYVKTRADITAFNYNKGKVKISVKSDLEKIVRGHSFLANVASEYLRYAEKGITTADTRAIVQKRLNHNRVFFFRYDSIERFIERAESSVLLITILLTIFSVNKLELAVIGLSVFAAVWIMSLFFDYKPIQNQFIDDAAAYLDLELGRFYAVNMTSAVNMLRIDMANSMLELSKGIEGTVKDTMNAITSSIGAFTAGFAKIEKGMASAADKWQETAQSGAEIQDSMKAVSNEAARTIAESEKAFEKITLELTGFSKKLDSAFAGMGSLVETLKSGILGLESSNESVSLKNKLFEEQLTLVRENQKTLELSVSQFEFALQSVTTDLGETLGRIVSFQTQESFGILGGELQDYVKQVFAANNELIQRMRELFEQIREQNRTEMAAIMNIKEQMDLQFEAVINGAKGQEAGNGRERERTSAV